MPRWPYDWGVESFLTGLVDDGQGVHALVEANPRWHRTSAERIVELQRWRVIHLSDA